MSSCILIFAIDGLYNNYIYYDKHYILIYLSGIINLSIKLNSQWENLNSDPKIRKDIIYILTLKEAH